LESIAIVSIFLLKVSEPKNGMFQRFCESKRETASLSVLTPVLSPFKKNSSLENTPYFRVVENQTVFLSIKCYLRTLPSVRMGI